MGIVINNASFRLTNSRFFQSPPVPRVGEIFRLVNVGVLGAGPAVPTTFEYINISGSIVSTGIINSGSVAYILAKSGSLTDSGPLNNGTSFVITNLLITTIVDETPSFTEEIISTTGAGTWTKPTGVTQVIVECWGGGGAGGGATINDEMGGGGAGGAFVRKLVNYTAPSANKSYSVAATAVGIAGNGPNGNDTTWESNVAVAKGGGGGLANSIQTQAGGGIPGVGNIGDIVYEGSAGGDALSTRSGDQSGFGGNGPGSANISDPNSGIYLEFGAALADRTGNSTAPGLDVNGVNGGLYGGGGSGANRITNPNKLGGNGAQGLIRLIYR